MQNGRFTFLAIAAFGLAFMGCQTGSKAFNRDVIMDPNFPPSGGAGDPLIEKVVQCDARTNPDGWYWKVRNVRENTITLLVQIDSDKLPEAHPVWKQITLGPNAEQQIDQCDYIRDANQRFYFSISGTRLGDAPLWPMPNGNRSKDMPILIDNGKTTYLANRHSTRRLRVRYQITGRAEQNLDVDANSYGPVSKGNAVRIIDANYI
jgi:hypothetical protein